jgi:hypothetical protein
MLHLNDPGVPTRVRRLQLPERAVVAGTSARQADRDLLTVAPPGYLDTTHFDTERFPPPAWALERFCCAAADGSSAYTSYRGHKRVLDVVADTLSGFLGAAIDPDRNTGLSVSGRTPAEIRNLRSLEQSGRSPTLPGALDKKLSPPQGMVFCLPVIGRVLPKGAARTDAPSGRHAQIPGGHPLRSRGEND